MDVFESLFEIVAYVDKIAVVGLIVESTSWPISCCVYIVVMVIAASHRRTTTTTPSTITVTDDHPLVQDAVLSFFEVVCELNLNNAIPFVIPPSRALVLRMLMCDQAIALSRMAGILVTCV